MIAIDLIYLIQILLPIDLRKSVIVAFTDTFRLTIQSVFDTFYLFFASVKYDLTFNGQVILLEHLLNDKFDNINRQIYIDDDTAELNTYIFNRVEDNENTYIFNQSENEEETYLFNQTELSTVVDFTIYIPIGLNYSLPIFKKMVDKYKLPGKIYSIVEV